MEMNFKIFRFDPEVERKPHYQTYRVSAHPTERILDCLNRIDGSRMGHSGTVCLAATGCAVRMP